MGMVEANTPGDFLRTNFALAPLSHGGEDVVAVVVDWRWWRRKEGEGGR